MKDFHYGVFIGRFQPLHLGHQHVIDEALKRVETLIVVVGSAHQARTPVNPLTYMERASMIMSIYRHEAANGRLIVIPADDNALSDAMWSANVYDGVKEAILDHANNGGVRLHGIRDFKIALTGFGKDASSFYLSMFPQWDSIQIDTQHGTINASDIRHDLLRRLPRFPHDAVCPVVLDWLKGFALRPEFKELVAEAEYYRDYPATYGKGPFLTADVLVRHRGKVLLVTRGKTPGKGLLAMPGGFVNDDERIWAAALRELREETTVKGASIEDYFAGSILADDPRRSLRGRVVSNVFVFEVEDEEEIERPVGSDDAAHADWYDFDELRPEQFFEDHHALINQALNEEYD